MDWRSLLEQGHIEIDGKKYGLEHLKKSQHTAIIPKTAHSPEMTAILSVSYSSHCVTEGCSDEDWFDRNKTKEEYRVLGDKNEKRIFCYDRYQLSFYLPGIFLDFTSKRCRYAKNRNYLIVEFLADNGVKIEYHVFFNMRKSKGGLVIYVESAYAPNTPPPMSKSPSMHAVYLMAKIIKGQPIKFVR